ncbi:MAG TPA: hypothetical protein VEK34_05180 [Methylocella sp.]|nr:hypothetical protein [Methylocella sp.]
MQRQLKMACAKAVSAALALIFLASLAMTASPAHAQSLPGYSVPTYTCARNWYLDPNGNDNNSGNSSSSPWQTMQRADASVSGGDCVNLAPGAYYTAPITITHGGYANTSTGYVVYRSTTPQTGHIIMAYSAYVDLININTANYLIFDGLELDGNNNSAQDNCLGNYPNGIHHIVVENSLVHGCGFSGIGFGFSEYLWIVNNKVYNNDALYNGSGISVFEPDVANVYDPAFSPNGADQGQYYHIIVANNVVYNNVVTYNDGSADHTDGNGIIFDDFNHSHQDDPRGNVPYPQPSLIEGNYSYNNGASGIQVYSGQGARVANNSLFDNCTDPLYYADYWRADIRCVACDYSTFVNNAVYSVPGSSGYPAWTLNFANDPNVAGSNTWSNNIGNTSTNWGTIPSTGSFFGVDPKFNNPWGGDFSLQAGSLALGTALAEPWLTSSLNMGAWQSAAATGTTSSGGGSTGTATSAITVLLASPSALTRPAGGYFGYSTNWQGGPTTGGNWEIFVHFTDQNGNIIWQDDHNPTTPTSQWSSAWYQDGPRFLNVPSSVPAGVYDIRVGLYNTSWQRYSLNPGTGVTVDNQLRYTVGTITVQ